MRKFILAAVALGAAFAPAAASAQSWGGRHYGYGYNRGGSEYARELRECRRELARADSRREYAHERRECRRELREALRDGRYDRYHRYDRYNRYDRYRRW